MVVHSPEPTLEVHDRPVQFWEIASLFARWYLYQIGKILPQRPVSRPLVGSHLRTRSDMVPHEAAKGRRIGTGYLSGIKSRNPVFLLLYTDHDQLLIVVLSAPYAFLLSPEDGFIHLGRSRYRVVPGTLHGLHDLAFEGPAGLLPKGQFTTELGRGDALLVRADEIYDVKGLDKIELYLVEKRARCGGFRVIATGTLS